MSGNQLGDNRVLNPDFIGNFIPHIGKVIYDIETQPSRMYSRLATDIRTSPIVPKLGNKDAFSDWEGMIIQKVTQDEMLIGGNLDTNTVKELSARIQKMGVTLALGGLGQYIKQYIPPIADTSLRLKNKGALATSFKLNYSSDYKNLKNILSQANIARRDAKDNILPDSGASKIDPKELNKLRGLLSKMGMKAGEIQDLLMDISLTPLSFSDKMSAEVSWLAFYLDSLSEQGKSIDFETVDRKALDYADTMTSLVANESDPAMKSNLSKSDWVKYTMPFMSFAFNSTADLVVNIARLSTSNDSTSRREAIRSIAGNITAKATFSAISAGIAYVTASTIYEVMQKLVQELGEDDEKEELLEELSKEYDERIKNLLVRRIGYAVSEVITGGIFSQVFEPVLEPLSDAIAGTVFTEDEIKSAKFKSSKSNLESFISSLGLYGVAFGQINEAYKAGKRAFNNGEEFIKDRYGVVNSELTDIVVDDYRLSPEGFKEYDRPEFAKYVNIASFVASLGALTGASTQEVRAMRRGSSSYERVMTDLLRGRGSNKSVKERVKEAKMISEIEDVNGSKVKLDKQQAEKLLSYRAKELEKLKKDPFVKEYQRQVTKEDFENFIRDYTTDLAKQKLSLELGVEMKDNSQEIYEKALKEQEEYNKRLNYKKPNGQK